jgi:PKD repeat protein
MSVRRVLALLLSVVLPVLGLSLLLEPAAIAHQPSLPPPTAGALPSAVPSAITPQVDDGEVWTVAQVGNLLVMGGTFTSIGGTPRASLAAINKSTGALSTTFAPSTNGQVYSVLPGPNDHTVYVGGDFTQVNGQPEQFLTMLDTVTGAIVPTFNPPAFDFGMIRDMAKSGNRLYVGGFFSKVGGVDHAGIATLNVTSGALDPFMNVQFAGHHNDSGSGAQGWVGPWSIDVSPDGSRLVIAGNFKTADGLPRDQVVLIDLDGGSATVDPNWSTTRYNPYCFNWAFDGYVRGVTFSPDGSFFVVTATGGGARGTLCDATARFETASTGTNIQPTWVDETGGDTVWGVTVTDSVLYIGGHNRWNNNPLGSDTAQPGAVPRPGLAALDPANGRPFTWNPGHNPLGRAVYALLATSDGLWMGYDNNFIGNYKYPRQKIAFFPYAGGYTPAATTNGQLPGSVYLGRTTSNGQTNVLYRVDAGGPALSALDGGPDWGEDDAALASPYRNAQGNAADWSPVPNVNSTVPATTPRAIFDHERWSPNDSPALTWTFPVTRGTHTQVRLYFANRCTCTSGVGQRRFNVAINGSTVLSNFDIVAAAGDQTGMMRSFNVTVPSSGTNSGRIQIALTHRTENPLINGIEIINTDLPAPPPPSDSLSAVGFDGSTATTPQTVLGSGIAWGQTRGAFMVGNQLFYGYSDGYLYRTTLSGSTFGTSTQVNPYHDPLWKDVDSNDGTTFDGNVPQLYSQLANMTGMFYSAKRLYFTLANDPALHWVWFSPDSGIADNTQFTASSSVNFSQANGMFLSGSTLYFAKKSDKSLYKVSFSGGAVTGTEQLVDGPGTGGNDWTNRSMFFAPSPPANQKPTAAFGSSCTGGGCAFDGSGSSDPDGSVTGYSWNFGDGSPAGTGVTTSHSYAATGTYNVTLTVTDNSGGTDTISHQVTITSLNKQIQFVGAAHSGAGSTATKSARIPATANVGDTMLLAFTWSKGITWTGPGAGWTQVGATVTNVSVQSAVWSRQVAAGDAGTNVTMSTSAASKAVLSLAVYSGVSPGTPIDAIASVGDAGGISHSTPTVSVTAGDWAVSWWTDKSAAVAAWTAPAGVTQRDVTFDSGTSARYSMLLADSGGPVAAGTYGGLTATTDTSSDKAVMWTVALRPGVAGNEPPTAAFTSSCNAQGSCSFDGSGSSDGDGTIASYAWTFGDGGTSTQQQPTHAYAASGSYDVTLTVTDNGGASRSVTQTVSVTVPVHAISYVGASHSLAGSRTTKSVAVPLTAQVGDTMVLVFTWSKGVTWTGPGAGWTQLGSTVTNVRVQSAAWVRAVAASDPGSSVTLTTPTASKAVLSLALYRGVDAANPVDAFAAVGDAGGTSHATPAVTVAAGDWVASWWTDKSTAVTAWTPPAGVTERDDVYDTGTSARYSAMVADSGGPVAAGSYGGLTATTDTASDKAVMWTIALKPA